MASISEKLLFIHIPRCGGATCRKYLCDNVPAMLDPAADESPMPIGHVRLQDVERLSGRSVSSFDRIVAVVRHPCEQQLSQCMFWAGRYLQGQRQSQQVATWRHISEALVRDDLWRHRQSPDTFRFQPDHANMAAFVRDNRCDFNRWHTLWHALYFDHRDGDSNLPNPDDDLYRYWLNVDSDMPENLIVVRHENLAEDFCEAVRPFVTTGDCKPFEHLNSASYAGKWEDYYTPLAIQAVRDKAPWAIETFYSAGS